MPLFTTRRGGSLLGMFDLDAAMREPPSADDLRDQALTGANVARLRKEKGLSQTALAVAMREAGHQWHQNTVSRVENGAQELNFNEISDLTDLVGPVLHGTGLERTLQRAGKNIVDQGILSRLRKAEEALAEATTYLSEARKIVEGQQRRRSE